VVAILSLSGGILFPDMSVHENLEMGAYPCYAWKRREETLKQVYQIFPTLKEREAVSSHIERRQKANVSDGSEFDIKAETMPV
jgi:ABC-type branched-subunit amino acid transport system ATPase component